MCSYLNWTVPELSGKCKIYLFGGSLKGAWQQFQPHICQSTALTLDFVSTAPKLFYVRNLWMAFDLFIDIATCIFLYYWLTLLYTACCFADFHLRSTTSDTHTSEFSKRDAQWGNKSSVNGGNLKDNEANIGFQNSWRRPLSMFAVILCSLFAHVSSRMTSLRLGSVFGEKLHQ